MPHESDLHTADYHRLLPGTEVLLSGDNKLMVRTPFGTTVFSGDLICPELVDCIRSLDGTRTLSQALARIDARRQTDYAAFLQVLTQRKLLNLTTAEAEDRRGPGAQPTSDNHEDSYWRLHTSSAEDAQRRLQSATVLISGLGGAGVALASALAAAGIGKLILADSHQVHQSDVRLGYLGSALGMARAQALAAALRGSPCDAVVAVDRCVEHDEDWDSLIASSQLVILTSDNMALSGYERTNDSCLRLGRPWISARIDRNVGMIGPYVVPGQTACFACYELRARANADHASDHESIYRHWHTVQDCPPNWPVLPPATQLLGNQLALDALRVIGGQRLSAAYGKVLHIDLDSLLCQAHEVLKLPRCPACSRSRLRPLTRIWDISEAPTTKGQAGEPVA